MFCPNCGSQIPDGSAFCPNCGTRLGTTQQPQYGAPQQPQYGAPQSAQPPKKKSGVMIVIACVAVLAVLGVAWKVLSGRDGGGPSDNRPGQTTDVTAAPNVTQPSGSPSAAGTQSGGSQSDSAQSGSAQTGGESGGWDESWLLGDNSGSGGTDAESYKAYSTYDLPVEADFDWFYDRAAGTVNASVPQGAELITDPEQLFGGWKCFVMRKPTTAPIRQYWSLDLSIYESEVACDQFWSGRVENGKAFEDLSAANSNPLFGTIDQNCVMDLKDDYGSTLSIIQWYRYNGMQYGVGTYECGWDEEDSMGLAAVCRP